MAYKVYIDAGHGGYDNGAQYMGRKEKDETLRLALAVGDILQQNGVEVGYTRTSDIYQSPFEKAQIANNNEADLLISIHRNAAETPNLYSGVQSLLYDESGIKKEIAENINKELEDLGFTNLGIEERTNLAILKRSKMPAVLVEAGFIDSDTDNEIFDAKFNEIAQAISNGIMEAIGDKARKNYRVQVGLYRNYGNAQYEVEKLSDDGFVGYIEPWGEYYAVQVGGFQSIDEAVFLQRRLQRKGYDTLIVG